MRMPEKKDPDKEQGTPKNKNSEMMIRFNSGVSPIRIGLCPAPVLEISGIALQSKLKYPIRGLLLRVELYQ